MSYIANSPAECEWVISQNVELFNYGSNDASPLAPKGKALIKTW